MSEDLPTDPKGSEPPLQFDLVVEMRTMFSSLLSDAIGKLRTDIVDATTAASQVAEQLGRFNTNVEAIRHEVQRLTERMTSAELRLHDLEHK